MNGAAGAGTGAESKLVVFEFGEVTEGQGILVSSTGVCGCLGKMGEGE